MTLREADEHGFERAVRWGLAALLWCVAMCAAGAEAWFRIVTPLELHAYRTGAQGSLPFSVFAWSVRRFGQNPMALRLPLLVVFAVLLAIVMFCAVQWMPGLSLNRLVLGVLVLLVLLGAWEFHSLRNVRVERYALHSAMDCIERATAPGEAIVVYDPSLALRISWYAPDWLREQLRLAGPQTSPVIPRLSPQSIETQIETQKAEFIFIGPPSAPWFDNVLRRNNVELRACECGDGDIAPKFEALGAGSGTRVNFAVYGQRP